MSHNSILVGLGILGLLLAVSSVAVGKDTDKELSRKHFTAGMSLLDTNNYKVAADEFESSIRLYPTKNGYFNLAVCYIELHRINDAVIIIERLKKEFHDELDSKWKQTIAEIENKIESAIVPVEFRANIDNVTIKLDGQELGGAIKPDSTFYVDPGEHTVTLSADGYETINESVSVKPGQGRTVFQFVMVRLSDIAPEDKIEGEQEEDLEQNTTYPVYFKDDARKDKKKKRKVGTAIAFSIGGAAGLAAITTGVINLAGVSKIRDKCGGDTCTDLSLKSSVDTIRNLGITTNVLISVSAVGIVLGTILAFVEGESADEAQRVSVDPSVWDNGGGLIISGKF